MAKTAADQFAEVLDFARARKLFVLAAGQH